MNRKMLEELEKKIPNFKTKHCEWVNIDNMIVDEANSQIRKNGKVAAKVPGMVIDIEQHGQQVPGCGRRLPNGQVELKDGITRFSAIKDIGDSNESFHGQFLVSFYHDGIFDTNDEWIIHQAKCNDHEPSTANTSQDIRYQINKMYVKGTLTRMIGFKHAEDPKEWIKSASNFLKEEVYTRSPLTKESIKNIVKGIINKSLPVGERYENYTKSEGFEFFSKVNTLGWSGTAGNVVAGHCVYAVTGAGDEKDLMGNAYRKSGDHPHAKFDVIAWVGDLSDKDDSGLAQARQRIYDMYSKGVSHPKFGRMLNDIYFLPQIKSGPNEEDMLTFYTPRELGINLAGVRNLTLAI